MLINKVQNSVPEIFIPGSVSTDTVKIYTSDDDSQFMLDEALKDRSRVIKHADSEEECLGIRIWHNKIELITLPGSINERSELDISFDDSEEFDEVINIIIDITYKYKMKDFSVISIDTLIDDLFITFPTLKSDSIRHTKRCTQENINKINA